jgi:MtrB/PioB family decaheme-associated outer membrane protein
MRYMNIVRGSALVASALLLPAAATGQMTFRIDPIVFEVLEADVDTESAKFEEYRDLGSGFRIPELGIFGETADGNRHLAITGENIGRNDARLGLRYGVWDRFGIELDYNKIQHRFGNDALILWDRSGPGEWTVPDALQQALQERLQAAFPNVNTALLRTLVEPLLNEGDRIDLGLRRDRFGATIDLGGLDGLTWKLGMTHENRVGTRAYGASFGFGNVTELPEPIDYDTTGAELKGEWNTKRGGLNFGYRYSKFENNISTVVWDNPFRFTDSTDPNAYQAPGNRSIGGAVLGFADLAPDNESNQFFVGGRFKLAGNWWAGGGASYAVITQDDPFLPYTLNTAINGAFPNATNPSSLPVSSLDGEVKTLSLNADVGGRFAEDFTLTFRYRYYEYDNNTPRIFLPGYVRYHGVFEDIPRVSVPYSHERDTLSATLGWDLNQKNDLELLVKLQTVDRTFRETESTDEDLVRLSWSTRPTTWLNLRASFERGDRTYDAYHPHEAEASFAEPGPFSSLEGLRRFDQANREYDEIKLWAQFLAGDRWSFAFGIADRAEDYPDSEFGLVSDDVIEIDGELAFMIDENSTLTVFGHRSDRESFQRSRQSGATPSTNPNDNWSLLADELNDTWGFGYFGKAGRWNWTTNLRWAKSDGEADFDTPPGGTPATAVDFDNYEDIELLAFDAKLDFALNSAASVGLTWLYEDYTLDSFILQGLQNVLPGAILLNANNGDYTANVVGGHIKLSW